MFGLSLDIVPTLVTAVKWGSIPLGLNMGKKLANPASMFSGEGMSMSNFWDGFKSMRPTQIAVIFCSFVLHKTLAIWPLIRPILFFTGLLTILFAVMLAGYMICLYLEVNDKDKNYDFAADDYGSVVLKLLLAIVEFLLFSVVIALLIFGLSQALVFFTPLSLKLIADISYIAVLAGAMLFNYFYEKDNIIYDLLPVSITSWFSGLSLKTSEQFAKSDDLIQDANPTSVNANGSNASEVMPAIPVSDQSAS